MTIKENIEFINSELERNYKSLQNLKYEPGIEISIRSHIDSIRNELGLLSDLVYSYERSQQENKKRGCHAKI